jgi:hypothetical protein
MAGKIRYIYPELPHQNPVRAGMVNKAERYEYSTPRRILQENLMKFSTKI